MARRNLAIEVSQRATITIVDDSGKVQTIQVQCDEGDDPIEIEMLTPFGFSSNPPRGSDVVLVQPDADADASIAVAAQHADHRATGLQPGEVALYGMDGEILLLVTADKKLRQGARTATSRAVLGTEQVAALKGALDAIKTFADALGAGTGAAPNAALTVAQALAAAQVLAPQIASAKTALDQALSEIVTVA